MSAAENHMIKMIQRRVRLNSDRIAFVIKKLLEPITKEEREKYEKALKKLYKNQENFLKLEDKMGGNSYEL